MAIANNYWSPEGVMIEFNSNKAREIAFTDEAEAIASTLDSEEKEGEFDYIVSLIIDLHGQEQEPSFKTLVSNFNRYLKTGSLKSLSNEIKSLAKIEKSVYGKSYIPTSPASPRENRT